MFADVRGRRSRSGGRALLGRSLLAATALIVAVSSAGAWPGAPAPAPAVVPAFALYAASDASPYRPLDPITFADRTDADPIDVVTPFGSWAISADGSTVVVIEGRRTIVVRDGLDGPERLRFESPANVVGPRLSGDGSRLVTSIPLFGSPSGISRETWYVFDTRDGSLLSTVEEDGPDPKPGGFPTSLIDPSAERLYRFAAGAEGPGPWPLQIVAHDLTTGAEVGRLTLPDVRAGARYERWIDQAPVEDVLTPGVALSPDGDRLAIFGGETDTLTLVGTRTLTVEQVVAVVEPAGLARRALTWLGLVPRSASAKYTDGRVFWAAFSPDGRRLYVHGFAGEVEGGGEGWTERGLGLMAVDFASGEIVATALDGQVFSGVFPAPDGRDVYVSGPTVPWSMASREPSCRLARLDAVSLETRSERVFPERCWLLLVSAPPAPV